MDSLVQTSLTDKCYLSLTQAMHYKLGGSPFGPSGTGKTETVKSLGALLGQLVLVFCCDENFNFYNIGRILTGICKVGAWACFDEFNRLEERMLSSVSDLVWTIQDGLKRNQAISLVHSGAFTVQSSTGNQFILCQLNYQRSLLL